MSDNMFAFIVVAVTFLIPLVLFPILIIHKEHDKDKITKLEQRIEKLEKIVTYIEMKEQF